MKMKSNKPKTQTPNPAHAATASFNFKLIEGPDGKLILTMRPELNINVPGRKKKEGNVVHILGEIGQEKKK